VAATGSMCDGFRSVVSPDRVLVGEVSSSGRPPLPRVVGARIAGPNGVLVPWISSSSHRPLVAESLVGEFPESPDRTAYSTPAGRRRGVLGSGLGSRTTRHAPTAMSSWSRRLLDVSMLHVCPGLYVRVLRVPAGHLCLPPSEPESPGRTAYSTLAGRRRGVLESGLGSPTTRHAPTAMSPASRTRLDVSISPLLDGAGWGSFTSRAPAPGRPYTQRR